MMIQILFFSFFTTIIATAITSPGSCPANPPGTFGICVELCSGDEDCGTGQKCCSNGCGHVCKNVISTTTPSPCNPVACKCPYGTIWFKDENGCDMCSCKPSPCATVLCPTGKVCQVNTTDNTAKCVSKCSEVMCAMYCENGFEYDQNGCPICRCLDPCANVKCDAGKLCTVTKSNCTTYSSSCQPYVGTCVTPQCSPAMCLMYCENGFEYDNTGCPICKCLDPCANAGCSSDQICTVQKSGCTTFSANCQPYIGVCTPKCGPVCEIYCPYGHLYDDNGCQKCGCSNPCANVTCRFNQVCKPQKSTCSPYSSTCSEYTGVCVRKCKDVICNIRCKYGLFYDVFGCPQCKCLSDPCANVLCPPKQVCTAKKSTCTTYSIYCQPFIGVCG